MILPDPSRPAYDGFKASILSQELFIQSINCSLEAFGEKDFIRPNNPATIGADIEVPVLVSYPEYGIVLKIELPGAATSILVP